MIVSTLPSRSFLSDVTVYRVDDQGHLVDAIGAPIEELAQAAILSGTAEVSTDPRVIHSDSSAALAIPVYRSAHVISLAVISAKRIPENRDDVVGVLEVWEPVGIYEDLALKSGFYGRMERFRNVSSFVRFEKGTGLPGQVWQHRTGVIHDDLSNHPGFLRAAGASADLLVTAVGIPIASTAFHAAAVLISSTISPLARGFEVWQAHDDHFSLIGGTYRDLGEGIELLPGTSLPRDKGLPGLAGNEHAAVICEDVDTLFAGRNHDAEVPESASGLAIPFFNGDSLASVTTLLF